MVKLGLLFLSDQSAHFSVQSETTYGDKGDVTLFVISGGTQYHAGGTPSSVGSMCRVRPVASPGLWSSGRFVSTTLKFLSVDTLDFVTRSGSDRCR